MSETIHTRILSSVALVFEATATAISATNSEGMFDILPDHARFMSLLAPTPVTIELHTGQTKVFTFENAVLFFEDNVATIYVQEPLQKMT